MASYKTADFTPMGLRDVVQIQKFQEFRDRSIVYLFITIEIVKKNRINHFINRNGEPTSLVPSRAGPFHPRLCQNCGIRARTIC